MVILNVKNNNKNIRLTRKVQQLLYNQGLVLFLFAIFIIFMAKRTDSQQTPIEINAEDNVIKQNPVVKTT